MKLPAISLAFVFLILVSGCLSEEEGADPAHINLTNASPEMDSQACYDNSKCGGADEPIETNTTAATFISTMLPRVTSTTLHPSQAGPSAKRQVPIKYKATVYKEKDTCRCCDLYFDYIKAKGFELEVIETDDMASIYREHKIPHHMQSCHTLFIDDYFIEGHVPMKAIEKLLTEKPDIDGITLPGKPYGAPGMRGAKSGKFTIYALSDGKASLFLTL
jgi:hypothetical protein